MATTAPVAPPSSLETGWGALTIVEVLATPDIHRAAAGQGRAKPARTFSSPLALSGLLAGRSCARRPADLLMRWACPWPPPPRSLRLAASVHAATPLLYAPEAAVVGCAPPLLFMSEAYTPSIV
ncbi:hypothetical protein L7F22_055561 [Adiantum nelumboides]|nr:hypothetical protein [Adiantum nelumboides]